jgi:hypothetical protein
MRNSTASTFVALSIFILVLYLFRNSIASIFNKTAVGASSSSIATFGAPVVAGALAGNTIESALTSFPVSQSNTYLPDGSL